ncbi:MAG: addiction module protein [Cyanobacteria bacterium P01_G01_bin.54]
MSHSPININVLTKDEKLNLLKALWESLDAEAEMTITPAQHAELRVRSQALHQGTLKTLPVDDVLNAIRSRNV